MVNFLTRLSKRRFPYEPLITIEISKGRLIHNLNEFRKLAPGGSVAPVLKSNAYGHGLFEVAEILEKESDIPFFVIDSYFEAVALHSDGIRTPLLIIGYTRPETIMDSRLKNVAFTITSLDTLKSIRNVSRSAHIHLKIDTGMRRQGIMPEEMDEAITLIQSNSSIILEGICSHLSDSDNPDDSFTKNQILLWNSIVKKFKVAFPSLQYIHLAPTYGHRFQKDIDANVSRLGIGLYGLSDSDVFRSSLNLKPAMEMKTIITGIKRLKKGETVGYSNTFTATNDMTIATVPVGYFEGLDRRLSNSGSILIGRSRTPCPIIGRVSMNITSIDVSKVQNMNVGDLAIVISNDPSDQNSLEAIAKKCGTITYEIVVKIPAQLKRVVVD